MNGAADHATYTGAAESCQARTLRPVTDTQPQLPLFKRATTDGTCVRAVGRNSVLSEVQGETTSPLLYADASGVAFVGLQDHRS